MNHLLLGIRMAFSGGREALARMTLMAIGVVVGVVLILVSLTFLPALQAHVDRLAWHRTDASDPPTAPDQALWLAVTDRYAGQDVIRVHVAALGPRPPVPPGVQRLPGPGEVVLSPRLAELIRTVPPDQLGDRFPGRIVGTIGPDGLIMPDELVGIVGRTPEQMRDTHGAVVIRGIEQPAEQADLLVIWGFLIGLLGVLIIGPVMVFVMMATRVGGARRDQRFAAVRLAGATRLQIAVLAATETAGAALVGILLGCLCFLAVRPVVASQITLGHGMSIFPQDVRVPIGPAVLLLTAVLVLAVGTTLVSLRPVQITPLGVPQRRRRRPPRLWRLLPIGVGILATWQVTELSADQSEDYPAFFGLLSVLAPLSILVGLFLSGALVCHWASRTLARCSRSPAMLMVARRIAADPYSTFRSVAGAALAMYVAANLGLLAAAEKDQSIAVDPPSSVLDPNVVAVHVQGAPEESLGALRSGEVVIARVTPGGQISMSCGDLAQISSLDCPLPTWDDERRSTDAVDLFTLPYPGSSGVDRIFTPQGFVEPDADAHLLPIQTIFVRTDGSTAAMERVRTLAAAVPTSRSKTSADLSQSFSVAGLETVLPYAMVFVLLVAACSLTMSVINGVLERRRPFALLRASGMGLGELRRVVILETGIPLALTTFGGVALAMLTTYLAVPAGQWVLPSPGFLAGLGVGALAAFAVSLIALPFMDIATKYDSVRYE